MPRSSKLYFSLDLPLQTTACFSLHPPTSNMARSLTLIHSLTHLISFRYILLPEKHLTRSAIHEARHMQTKLAHKVYVTRPTREVGCYIGTVVLSGYCSGNVGVATAVNWNSESQ